jgi:hypothetical protein
MRLMFGVIRNLPLTILVTAVICLSNSGCESMIDGIGDSLTHDSDVKHYENLGFSHEKAERRVFEDNYFDEN